MAEPYYNNFTYSGFSDWAIASVSYDGTCTVSFSTPSPLSFLMGTCTDLVKKFRNFLSDADTKVLKKQNFLDDCGNITDAGIRVWLEDQMRKEEVRARLVEIAKDLQKEDDKDAKKCTDC